MSHSCPKIKYVGLKNAEFSIPGIHELGYTIRFRYLGGKRRLESKDVYNGNATVSM